MLKKTALLAIIFTAAASGILALFACLSAAPGRAQPSAGPVVLSVSPDRAPNHLDTPLAISGAGFTATLTGTTVLSAPQVLLGGYPLPGVTWASSATLSATVPWGLQPGVYTLTVVNPGGATGWLADAFTVTQALNLWSTHGPYGGSIRDIAVSPANTQTVFTSVSFAGLYQSRDGGLHWEHTSLGPGDLFHAVLYSPASPGLLYVSSPTGLWSSLDDGLTWTHVTDMDLMAFTPHPTDPDILYISRWDQGIFRSPDGGQTWQSRSAGIGLLRVRTITIDPADPATLYATTDEAHLYKSIDEGLTWNLADSGVTLSPDFKLEIAINPFNSNDLWLTGKLLYHSIDGAQSWDLVSLAPYEVPWAVAYNPVVSGTLYAGAAHYLLFSPDGGASWDLLSPFFFDGMIDHIRLDPATGQPICLGNNGGGFYRSPDLGLSWQQAVEGITGIEPRAVVPAPGSPEIVYLMTVDGVFTSSDGAQSWLKRKPGETHTAAVDPRDPLTAYAAQWGPGQIGKTTDGGQSWEPLTASDVPLRYVSALTLDPAHPDILLAGGGTHWSEFALSQGWLALSPDGGDHWQEISLGHVISEVTSIVVPPQLTGTLYLSTCTIHPYWDHGGGSGVLKSSDGGLTWAPANTGLADLCVKDLALHPSDPDVLLAAINDPAPGALGIYKTLDGGATWFPAAVGLDNSTVLEIAYDPLLPAHVYAATWRGLFYSQNGGLSWERIAAFGAAPVFAVAAAAHDQRTFLYIGVIGGTVTPPVLAADVLAAEAVQSGVYQSTLNRRFELHLFLPLVRR